MPRSEVTAVDVNNDTHRLLIGRTILDADEQRKEVWVTFRKTAGRGHSGSRTKITAYAGPRLDARQVSILQLCHDTRLAELEDATGKEGDISRKAYVLWAAHFGEAEFGDADRDEARKDKDERKRRNASDEHDEDFTDTVVEVPDLSAEQAKFDQLEPELSRAEYKKIGSFQQARLGLSKPPTNELLRQIRQAYHKRAGEEGSGRGIWLDPAWIAYVADTAPAPASAATRQHRARGRGSASSRNLNGGMMDQDDMLAAQGWGHVDDIDEVVAEERALFDSGRKALTDCREAITIASSELATVIKGGLALLHKIVGHNCAVTFSSILQPDRSAIWDGSRAFETVDEVQEDWEYEIVYSSFAPIEEVALGPLVSAIYRLKKAASICDPLGEDTSSFVTSERAYAALARCMTKRAEVADMLLTETIEAVASGLEKMLIQIGDDRNAVYKVLSGRFEAADDNKKAELINDAWQDAAASWPVSTLEASWQRDQLDQLSVVRKYHFTAPVLQICPKIMEAAQTLRKRFPA